LDGSGIHSSQPNVGGYHGSFFVSQNNTSWSAEQNIDLSFKLNRANFDLDNDGVGDNATVVYSNSISNKGVYNANVGDYYQGAVIETFENSNYVKVNHPNHGLNFQGAQAVLDRLEIGTYHGIPDSDIIGQHNVYFPTLNSFFIKTNTKANQNGFISTPSLFSRQSIVFDGMYMNLFAVKSESDTIEMEYRTTVTNSIDMFANSDKIVYSQLIVPTKETTYTNFIENAIVKFDQPRIVRNSANSSGNDLEVKLTLGASSKYVSPYFRKDVPHSPVLFRNTTGYFLDDSDIESLTVTSVLNTDNDDTNQKLASYNAGIQSVFENNAYITKPIDLEVPADGLTVFLDAAMFSENELEFYYKAKISGDETPYDKLEWVSFDNKQFINETNYDVFGTDENFKNYEVRLEVPYDFQSFKIKILMKTRNEAKAPKIKNLRIIADV
jgi:hypothetical protein